MSTLKKPSQGLRPLKLWQAILVPPVLLAFAWNTYLRDRIFAWLLPKRKYAKYVFVPREIPKPSDSGKQAS